MPFPQIMKEADPASNSQTICFMTKKNAKKIPEAIISIQKSKHPVQIIVVGLINSSGEKAPPVFLKRGLSMAA